MKGYSEIPEVGLVFKYPKGKLPFVGVHFENQHLAERTYNSWVDSYRTHLYELIFEFNGNTIELSICLPNFSFKGRYKIKEFNPVQVNQFLSRQSEFKQINFGHIITKDNSHVCVVSAVNRHRWVLPVNKITVYRM